jgi:hypothetical protein
MKKRVLSLGLMAIGMIVASLFTAAPAMAACSQAFPAATGYPNKQYTQYCDGATQAEGQEMATAVHNAPGAALNELRRANNFNDINGKPSTVGQPVNGVFFYIFGTEQQYHDWATANGMPYVQPGLKDFGITVLDANKVPIYAAIIKQNREGRFLPGINGAPGANGVTYGTGQQVGRALDYLAGYVKDGGIVPPVNFRLSDTGATDTWKQLFERELDKDYIALDAMTPCRTTPGGTPGLFTGFADSTYPTLTYICNGPTGDGVGLTATYNALPTNHERLNHAWPNIYPLPVAPFGSAPIDTFAGLFAEVYSAKGGINGNDNLTTGRTADRYLNVGFACTAWFASYVGNHGYLPIGTVPGDLMPANCVDPKPFMDSKCKKMWSSNDVNRGHFPDGNVFSCAVTGVNEDPDARTTDPIATTILGGLESLGRNNQPVSYTPIKAEFTRRWANVYSMQAPSIYSTDFNQAKQGSVGFTTEVAGSYPSTQLWFVILFRDQLPVGNKALYAATHELGHVFDDSRLQTAQGAQPSSLPTFDTAMQNDWLKLDYTDAAGTIKRNPCGSVALDGYKGPLVGVLDPSTMAQFCTGNVIELKWRSPVIKKTSEILRDPTVYGFDAAKPKTEFNPPNFQFVGAPIGFNPAYTPLAGWREWHAEAFAIRSQSDVASSPTIAIWSQIVANDPTKYFACTVGGWVQTEYLTGARVTPGAEPCQAALPGGWQHIPVNGQH